jgi:thymidine kinase
LYFRYAAMNAGKSTALLQAARDNRSSRGASGGQVVIGGNERYRAVCPSCFHADDNSGASLAPGMFG